MKPTCLELRRAPPTFPWGTCPSARPSQVQPLAWHARGDQAWCRCGSGASILPISMPRSFTTPIMWVVRISRRRHLGDTAFCNPMRWASSNGRAAPSGVHGQRDDGAHQAKRLVPGAARLRAAARQRIGAAQPVVARPVDHDGRAARADASAHGAPAPSTSFMLPEVVGQRRESPSCARCTCAPPESLHIHHFPALRLPASNR